MRIVESAVAGGGARGGVAGLMPVIEAHLDEYPRDILMLQQLNFAIQASGAADRKRRGLAVFQGLESAYSDDWAFNGMYAMTLQENDLFNESRERAELSLTERPKNATAIHPVAHVYFETNKHPEGEAALGKWL